MKSLVESLNNYLSRFIVESEDWMRERRLLGGDDALDGFKGEEGYNKAKEYFEDYLNGNIIDNQEFINDFRELLHNLFYENGRPRIGAAPLVICYEKNSPHTFALRRWTYDMTHKFFEKYGNYFRPKREKNYRLFKQYHNTTLSSIFTPSATDYEVIIAAALNMAINNSSMNIENYRKALVSAGCSNEKRFINFYDGEKLFIQSIIDYAKKNSELIDGVDCYKKLPNQKEDTINNDFIDYTPKTDIIGYKPSSKEAIRISIKKKSGAQLMSGSQQDTIGVLSQAFNNTFNIEYDDIINDIKNEDPQDAKKIDKALKYANKINDKLSHIKNYNGLNFEYKFIEFLKLLISLNWNGTDNDRNKKTNELFLKLFNENEGDSIKEFIRSILMNACTGLYKFTNNSNSVPNTMLSFDLTTNEIFVSDVESYIGAIVEWVWDADKSKRASKLGSLFRFNHKSHDNQVGKDMRKMVLRINIPSTKEIKEINKYAS